MKPTEYLRGHSELTQRLLDGGNAHAMHRLAQGGVELLRAQLGRDERVRACVIGRVLGAGRGVRVLTGRSLIALVGAGQVKVRKLELSALEAVASERSRCGQTLRLAHGWPDLQPLWLRHHSRRARLVGPPSGGR
jgi:hypothetical protein